MNDTYLKKTDVLKMIELNINKWNELKNQGSQDVTHENFITDVICAYQMMLRDVERMGDIESAVKVGSFCAYL